MEFFRKRILKLGNKGLSMVELICGITMLTIVGSSICSVLVVSANTYNRGSAEASVQQETQLVANQISDLLIDSTADVSFSGNILTIKQDGVVYTVEHRDNALYYKDSVTNTEQLMAEGVTHFHVDDSAYQTNGYAKLELQMENDTQQMPSNFTITSRNKETTTVNVVATVSMETDWLLEPGQEYDFDPVVSPSGAATGTFSVANNTSSSTSINSDGVIKIGTDEKSPVIRVKYTATDSSTGSVIVKYANVYVRRMNDVDVLGAYDPVASGTATQYKNGSKYSLSVVPFGNNLDQVSGKSYDGSTGNYRYVDPRQYEWTVVPSMGTSVSLASVNGTTNVLTLDADLQAGETVTVYVTNLHADGTNRENIDYGDVVDTWVLSPADCAATLGNGWMRQSNNPQADLSNASNIKTKYGADEWKTYFRYRKVDDSGNPLTSDWETAGASNPDGWLENIYGDAHNSSSANLRPLLTSAMDYRYNYQLEVCVRFYNAGVQVFPTDGVDRKDVNMVSDVVKRTQVTFDSDALGFTNSLGNTEASAPEITVTKDSQFTLMYVTPDPNPSDNIQVGVIGIDTNGTSVDNAYHYIVQKKQGDGSWQTVSETGANANGIEINNNKECRMTFRNADYAGNYRVLVQLDNMSTYDVNNNANGSMDYVMWSDPATGDVWDEEVYYFNVK